MVLPSGDFWRIKTSADVCTLPMFCRLAENWRQGVLPCKGIDCLCRGLET